MNHLPLGGNAGRSERQETMSAVEETKVKTQAGVGTRGTSRGRCCMSYRTIWHRYCNTEAAFSTLLGEEKEALKRDAPEFRYELVTSVTPNSTASSTFSSPLSPGRR